MRSLKLLALACLLPGCGVSTFVKPVPAAEVSCEDPVVLPERALGDQDIEILWGKDRTNLRICGEKHQALLKNQSRRVPEPSLY